MTHLNAEKLEESLLASQGRPLSFFARPENDVQKALRAGLLWFGPNGERWGKGNGGCSDPMEGSCAILALDEARIALGYGGHVHWKVIHAAEDALCAAIDSPRHDLRVVYAWNDAPDRTFAEVRAMFEKAIALAATPLSPAQRP